MSRVERPTAQVVTLVSPWVVTVQGSFVDIRGPGWARFPNVPGGPAGRVTRETLHRIPACISMHRRSRPNYRMSARDPPAREVSLTAAKDRTFKTVPPNQGTASETIPIPRRPSL